MEWFGQATVAFHHSRKSIALRLPDDSEVSLLDICKTAVPQCRLNPWLANGHLQTIWAATTSSEKNLYFRRRNFETVEPAFAGSFTVDFATLEKPNDEHDPSLPPYTTMLPDNDFKNLNSSSADPLVIVIPSLAGSSRDVYIREFLNDLLSRDAKWSACVLNYRGSAKSKITSGVLYHAAATWDLRQSVNLLHSYFPNRLLFAVGFSMGANLMINYLAEEGDKCLLKAAFACSNPWDLQIFNHNMKSSWLGSEIYSRAMAYNLKRLFVSFEEDLRKYTEIDVEKVHHAKYHYDIDQNVTIPLAGYPTLGSYYRDASSADSLLAVRIPLLALNALDDPISMKEGIPFEGFEHNPYAVLCTTTLGGHLGWLESGGKRWFSKPIIEFLDTMVRSIPVEQSKTLCPDKEFRKGRPSMHFNPVRRKLQPCNSDYSCHAHL